MLVQVALQGFKITQISMIIYYNWDYNMYVNPQLSQWSFHLFNQLNQRNKIY